MDDAELDAWCAEHRRKVTNYLAQQNGLKHGEIGDWPAWRVTPHVSLWAVESVSAPGAIGWWVICGDLPTDYCSGGPDCRIPRRAVAKIAARWDAALATFKPGDQKIGDLGIDGSLAPLLRARTDLLKDFLARDDLWPDHPT